MSPVPSRRPSGRTATALSAAVAAALLGSALVAPAATAAPLAPTTPVPTDTAAPTSTPPAEPAPTEPAPTETPAAGAPAKAAETAAPAQEAEAAADITPIRDIQGEGDSTPLDGQTVTTRGIVTAAYPTGGYNGFFLQTAGTGGELGAEHTASDAVFVYGSRAVAQVAIGDYVEVSGTAGEYNGLTQIVSDADLVTVLTEDAEPVTPAEIAWPRTDEERERFEGMLLAPQGDFTVTNTYITGQYAEIGLAAGTTPLLTPTEVARPGTPEFDEVVADNAARGVVLDDGASLNFQRSATDVPLPYLSLTDPVRVGAPVTFTRPVVLDYRFDAWKLQPTQQLTVDNAAEVQPATFANTRTERPADVGGTVQLASFNVLNYFTTTAEDVGCDSVYTDREGNPITANRCPEPGPRGAANAENLQRQQAKIVAALNAMDAEVVSLEEIENSAALGEPRDEALSTLVAALNADLGEDAWAFVPSPTALPASEDVIRTAFIYKKAAVSPVGDSVILDDPAFSNARQPLAQAFAPAGRDDAAFVAIVNHFKSKSDSDPAAEGDNAAGDQGAFNGDRVRQAQALVAFAGEQAESVEGGAVFLLGDFNAYTQEDPIQVLRDAGYVDLGGDTGKYTYSYDGQSGSLDHVLASPAARELVTGTDVWNINAGEALALEYSRYNANVRNFYDASPYRSSDHDPVVVGIDLSGTTELNLLNINDFHGRIDANTVKFAGTIEQLRAEKGDDRSLFLSNGDNIGASLFASANADDAPTIDVLNALEVAASGVGNHEFDKGIDDLTGRVTERAAFPYLGANVYRDGQPVLPGYEIVEVNGLRVGVVGAVTEETASLVSPDGIEGVEFREPVAEVNRVVAEIRDQVDVLVAEYHEGALQGETSGGTLDDAIARGGAFVRIVTETDADVDAIFTGHTHEEYAWDAPIPGTDGTRPVLQTGNYGENIGQVVLTIDRASRDVIGHEARNVPRLSAEEVEGDDEQTAENSKALDAELIATYPRVAEVADIVDRALAEAERVGSQPVGSVSADITTAFLGGSYVDGVYQGGERDDRSKQSALGNLVADALHDTLADPVRGDADLAVVNPGGLRAELLRGDDGVITFAEANAVLPFVNNLGTTSLTGDQLRRLLEQQWGDAAGRAATLSLSVSENVRYTFDATRAPGERITGIWIDGTPVDPAASYRVGSFSFLLSGGDAFTVFDEGTDSRDSGLIDRDGWIAYLGSHPDLAPDFTARGVQVTGAPAEAARGTEASFTVSGLDLTSLGSPAATEARVTVGSGESQTVPVSDGVAEVTVAVPADAPDALDITVSTASGSTATVPLRVLGGAEVPAGPGGGEGGEAAPPRGPDGLPRTGADTAWMGGGVLAALALLALGVAVRRRGVRQAD
ncbi:ExeM/NucH family extracellular endonuclease [Microbacterium testaceum]|uniref:ExeM/NucH family extracellular endonuclease n=1 Tax=Microbacterium testaceum TaxID=2033 RepID=UPI000A93DB31|nr:ExeM/NucH family extracellular endonuclease [Microbacterium testaceum]